MKQIKQLLIQIPLTVTTIEITNFADLEKDYSQKNSNINSKSPLEQLSFHFSYGKAFYQYAKQHPNDEFYRTALNYAKINFMFIQSVKNYSISAYKNEVEKLLPDICETIAETSTSLEDAAYNYNATLVYRLKNSEKKTNNSEEIEKILELYQKQINCFEKAKKPPQRLKVAKEAFAFAEELTRQYPDNTYYEEQKNYFEKIKSKGSKVKTTAIEPPPSKKSRLTTPEKDQQSLAEIASNYNQQIFNTPPPPPAQPQSTDINAEKPLDKMKIASLLSN